MANNFFKVKKGQNLDPQSSSTASAKGDFDVTSSDGKLNYHNGSSASPVTTEAHSATLTNKSIDATTNTLSNISNSEIATAAAIARSKLASGTAYRILANDSSGVMSENAALSAAHVVYVDGNGQLAGEATLATSRGGVGGNFSASTGILHYTAGVSSVSNIVNADVDAAAAIVYSKLSLSNSIVNGDIATAAAIARSKLASGTASHVLINDGSGVMSSEATLAKVRGGSGQDNSSLTFPATGTLATLAGTETFTNKTFGDALTLTDITTPSNPSSGFHKAYIKADGTLYILNSSGTETAVGSGGGGGGGSAAIPYAITDISHTFTAPLGATTSITRSDPTGASLEAASDVWSASGSLNTARYNGGGFGSQNACVVLGASGVSTAEKYNGASWAFTGSRATTNGYQSSGCGTVNAGLCVGGGSITVNVDKFNGLTFSATGSLNVTIGVSGASGSQSAAFSAGGYNGSAVTVATEKFNGSTWSVSGNMNQARYQAHGAGGSQTAGFIAGGADASFVDSATSEKFNGTTWSNSANMSQARDNNSGHGTQTNFITTGGVGPLSSTEKFNGTAFSSGPALGTARSGHNSGMGSGNSPIVSGGNSPGSTSSERYNSRTISSSRVSYFDDTIKDENTSTTAFNVVGGGAITLEYDTKAYASNGTEATDLASMGKSGNDNLWSSSGAITSARKSLGGAGTQSAALAFGGNTGSIVATAEKFNGATWTSTTSLSTARDGIAGAGHMNSALAFGGNTGAVSAVTESYNGSTWASGGNMNTARKLLAGCGVKGAAVSFGGNTGAVSAVTEKYNGSSWTASGSLNTARDSLGGSGYSAAGLAFGGTTGSVSAVTEKFNGSTWSASGSLNTARSGIAGSGSQGSTLAYGGNTGSVSTFAEKFDGSVWTVTSDMNTARDLLGGAGTQNAALSFGGNTGAVSAVTEKRISSYIPTTLSFSAEFVSGRALGVL